ncbi:hypothetical protein [Lacicoccus alkaliphilus]|uniref:Uncharacterized protein n=1 Tax=Lacicoccus alkaliphilus DSM 16010 TaxID=1123231 RepID=A0A1M7CLN2_9BACL|nr:hypothetical protein [Salinicoccus alkaliphilus]SHL67729.1 hypothetical protein SAMN02745189_00810 [Salinicoccus alkaliphilus DSM 16010]
MRCLKCLSLDFKIFNSNLLQCNTCMTIDNLLHLAEDYFHCLDKVMPETVYSRRDIMHHLGFDLNNYAYTRLTGMLFQKVSARRYEFTGRRD